MKTRDEMELEGTYITQDSHIMKYCDDENVVKWRVSVICCFL